MGENQKLFKPPLRSGYILFPYPGAPSLELTAQLRIIHQLWHFGATAARDWKLRLFRWEMRSAFVPRLGMTLKLSPPVSNLTWYYSYGVYLVKLLDWEMLGFTRSGIKMNGKKSLPKHTRPNPAQKPPSSGSGYSTTKVFPSRSIKLTAWQCKKVRSIDLAFGAGP